MYGRRTVLAGLLAALAAGRWSPAAGQGGPDRPVADLDAGVTAAVTEIVDGDTLFLADGTEVRLVGIQAPKLPLGRRNFTKWPLADLARAELGKLTLGREMTLRYGGRRVDRHGRALAHLVRDDGLWVQGALLQRGLARVYSFADNRALVPEMLAREGAARAARRGIWGNQWYAILPPEDLARHLGTFQLIEGEVLDAAEVRGMVYLNFGEDWRTDFTVSLRARVAKMVRRAGIEPLELAGKKIRVRGWLDNYNGPMIVATHPEQIEILD